MPLTLEMALRCRNRCGCEADIKVKEVTTWVHMSRRARSVSCPISAHAIRRMPGANALRAPILSPQPVVCAGLGTLTPAGPCRGWYDIVAATWLCKMRPPCAVCAVRAFARARARPSDIPPARPRSREPPACARRTDAARTMRRCALERAPLCRLSATLRAPRAAAAAPPELRSRARAREGERRTTRNGDLAKARAVTPCRAHAADAEVRLSFLQPRAVRQDLQQVRRE